MKIESSPIPVQQEPHKSSSEQEVSNGLCLESGADVAAGENEVSALAYRLWLERGSPEGSPEDDWFFAERELLRTRTPIIPPEKR